MRVHELKNSRFLTKEDCEPDLTAKIIGWHQEDVAKEGEPPEMRCILELEGVKPLCLNFTNGEMIQYNLGSDETDDWIGHSITLYHDRTVRFGNARGGIRVREKMQESVRPLAPQPVTCSELPPATGLEGEEAPF